MRTIFYHNIKSDTLPIWNSFLDVGFITTNQKIADCLSQYMFYHKDPRRVQPLVDFLVEAFTNLDFNAELSFDAVKITTLFRAFYVGLGRKFTAWTDQMVERSWTEIHSEHEDV